MRQRGALTTVNMVSFLIENFTARQLTKESDRVVAFSGLESRLSDSLYTRSSFGILDIYRHLLLLWHPVSEHQMKRVTHTNQTLPSWSWMTYSAAIRFLDFDKAEFQPAKKLCFGNESHKIIGELGELQNCNVQTNGIECVVTNYVGEQKGWLKYDTRDGVQRSSKQFIMVGRESKRNARYHILVIERTTVDDEYIRVGVGWVNRSFASKLGRVVTIV